MSSMPSWVRDLHQRIEAEASSLFVLHHNIADYVPLGQAFLPFPLFLAQWLQQTDTVIFYNRSTGLRFPEIAAASLHRESGGR